MWSAARRCCSWWVTRTRHLSFSRPQTHLGSTAALKGVCEKHLYLQEALQPPSPLLFFDLSTGLRWKH